MKKILVIGGGAMGAAITIPCLENKNKVTITEPYSKVFIEDLSIMVAKPTSLALAFFISLVHSMLDLPVVMTSSTIKTFDPFFILNPLLKVNFPLTLSQKIVSFFNNFPIS